MTDTKAAKGQHTPALYTAQSFQGSDGREGMSIYAGDDSIADLYFGQGWTDDEVIANANLFAAAPETAAERDRLRDALVGVCVAYGCECLDTEPQPHCAMCAGRAALAGTAPSEAERLRAVNAELLAKTKRFATEIMRLKLIEEALLPIVQQVANLGEYRELVDAMAQCLRPHERDSFTQMYRLDARAAIAKAQS